MKEIRKAKKSELPRVAEIFKEEANKKPWNEKWTGSSALKKIKDLIDLKNKIFIATIDNKVVGFITVRKEFTWYGNKLIIEEIFVKKENQAKGIGTSLVKFIVKKYKNQAKKILLTTSKTAPAFKFYKKLGFKQDNSLFMKRKI